MRYKPRLLAARLIRLIREFPVVVVSGARQVGKSTLLAHELDWEGVVFDAAMDIEGAREDPDLFLSNHPGPLILDEIRKEERSQRKEHETYAESTTCR